MRKLTQATESKCGVAPVTALLTLLVLSTVMTVFVFPFQAGVSNNLLTQRPPVTRVVRKRPVRPAPVFNYGVFATGTGGQVIALSGLNPQGIVDSWDSRLGSYEDTKQLTGGDIGANGSTSLSGTFNVYGSLSTPLGDNGLNDTSSGGVQGLIKLPDPVEFDDPPSIQPAPPTTNQYVATSCASIPRCSVVGPGLFALAPGTYGNLNLSGSSNRIILNSGIYNINSIAMLRSSMQVDSGPVRINVAGAGTSTPIIVLLGILNTNSLPGNLALVYGGTGTVTLAAGSVAAVIYAPNASVNMSANSHWYGAIVGNRLNASGGSSIHYDIALLYFFLGF